MSAMLPRADFTSFARNATHAIAQGTRNRCATLTALWAPWSWLERAESARDDAQMPWLKPDRCLPVKRDNLLMCTIT